VNLLQDNVGTIDKNTETLIDASMESGLEIKVENILYMLLSLFHNAGQNWDIKYEDHLKMCNSLNIWEQ
jgi:hypothetical protein